MTKYGKGTLGYYQEKAKEHGFDNITEYFKWKNKNINFNPLSNKRVRKEYHLWRWKIKRILAEENIIRDAYNWKTVLDKFDQLIIEILVNNKVFEKSEIIKKLKSERGSLIEHHTKYLEIHGADKTIWMTAGEHIDLHKHLRNEGKCNVPSDELTKISHRATSRTEKCKEYMGEIYKRESYKKCKSKYCDAYIMRIPFVEILTPNIRLREEIIYNIKTDTLTVSSGFSADRRRCVLPVIEID